MSFRLRTAASRSPTFTCGYIALLALFLPGALHAQKLWHGFPQQITTQNLWSIAYGNSTLVTVGEQGTILSSSYVDQVWESRAGGTGVWLVGVGFGAERFVVVGDRGTILTSDDYGATWTPRTSGTTIRLNAAVYGNGRWLVVGEQGTVLTSVDGTTWSARPALGTGFLRALAFGRGQFLLGGAGGALYSTTDATTFTAVPIATTEDIEGAAISTNRFFVVGSGGLRATATQLGAWTLTASGTNKTLRGIAVHSDDDATAVGDREAMTNRTGTWSTAPYPPPLFATAIVRGLNEIVTVGFGGAVARTAFDSPHFIVGEPFPNVVYGGEARFKLFTDEPPLSFQWTRGGVAVAGATTSELLLRNLTASATVGANYTTGGGGRTVPGNSIIVVPGGRPEVRDASFNSALPVVPTLVVPQADGKVLVAGSFSVTPTGGPTYGIARLNADGSIDADFRAGAGIAATSSIKGIAPLADGRIYVWGSFTAIAGQPRPGLARLLSNGALDPAFNPDTTLGFPTAAAAAPDGRVLVQNGDPANSSADTPASAISRLTLTGARDATFSTVVRNRLVAVDPQGRVLAVVLAPDLPRELVRYGANGLRDNSYTASLVSVFTGPILSIDDLAVTQLTVTGLYAASRNANRFTSTYSFGRFKPDGGRDLDYQSPPPIQISNVGVSSQFSFAYGPDGSLTVMRSIDTTYTAFRAEFYDTRGAPNPGQYATRPDLSLHRILAVAPDGALLGTTTANSANASTFSRVRPITGPVGRLTNLSVRAFVTSANEPLIAGFVTTGTDSTRAIVRAIGPGLVQFGVGDAMADPRLTLTRDGVSTLVNDNWDAALAPRFTSVGAFPLANLSKDSALESIVAAGNYTAVVTPTPGDSGTGLVELYESPDAPAPRRIVNVSARGPVTSARPLIVGFTVTGTVPVTVLVRGVGPALTAFGVAGALADPQLALYRADTRLWENDNWAPNNTDFRLLADAATRTGAFALIPNSNDAAMLVTLAPGSYTAVVAGSNNTAGIALVEVYEVP